MTNLQRAWHYWLAEPFTWIFYIFFQPQRFAREFETQYLHFRQRVVPMLRLSIPLFLMGYPLALAGQTILISFHLMPPDPFRLLLIAAVGVTVGIAVGIAGGIVFGIAVGIAGSVVFG